MATPDSLSSHQSTRQWSDRSVTAMPSENSSPRSVAPAIPRPAAPAIQLVRVPGDTRSGVLRKDSQFYSHLVVRRPAISRSCTVLGQSELAYNALSVRAATLDASPLIADYSSLAAMNLVSRGCLLSEAGHRREAVRVPRGQETWFAPSSARAGEMLCIAITA